MSYDTYMSDADRAELRDRAIRRLRKRRDFRGHVLVYALVNTFLVIIWWMTGAGFFWPAFVVVGWGIGVVMNAYDVYVAEDITEEDIEREVTALTHR